MELYFEVEKNFNLFLSRLFFMNETSVCAIARAQVNLGKTGGLHTEFNQRNSEFSCQNLFAGNIPTLKEHSEQSTENYNVLCTQDSEIFSTIFVIVF